MRLTGKGYLMGVLASSLVISLYGVVKASPGPATVQQTPRTTQEQDTQRKPPLRLSQSQAEVDAKSAGCQSCHTATDSVTMHVSQSVHIGCVDCHGGDPSVRVADNLAAQSAEYQSAKRRAHPHPKILDAAKSANPVRAY